MGARDSRRTVPPVRPTRNDLLASSVLNGWLEWRATVIGVLCGCAMAILFWAILIVVLVL
jgi:hypothetical protein